MNGKNKVNTQDPEHFKKLGNDAFGNEKYGMAINFYTRAINLSKGNPNHVYYTNRGNAKLQKNDLRGCIEDCEMAIQIDPLYIKAYARKAEALK